MAGKFGRELNLVVVCATAKLKSTNISYTNISYSHIVCITMVIPY